jgi:hypothetical protein
MTQKTLLFIAQSGSSIGMKILNWILSIGKTLGDKFISWDLYHKDDPGGFTDFGGIIHLNPTFSYNSAAAILIHEGVESYYAIQHGVRTQASQQMDYLAERFAGMYESQSRGKYAYGVDNGSDGGASDFYGAYGLSFTQWRATIDGERYASQPLVQAEVQSGHPLAPGYAIYRSGPFAGPSYVAVHGSSITELDGAYGELYNPDYLSPYDPLPSSNIV